MKEKLTQEIIGDGVMWDLTRRWFWIINPSVNVKAPHQLGIKTRKVTYSMRIFVSSLSVIYPHGEDLYHSKIEIYKLNKNYVSAKL